MRRAALAAAALLAIAATAGCVPAPPAADTFEPDEVAYWTAAQPAWEDELGIDLDAIAGTDEYANMQTSAIDYGYTACGTWPEHFVATGTANGRLSEQIVSTTWHLAQQFLCDVGQP